MDKLVSLGHSFGGITSILTGVRDKRVKACCSLDPWFLSVSKEGDDFMIPPEVPFLSVRTFTFMKFTSFDHAPHFRKFFDRHVGTNKKFNSVVMGRTSHVDQSDPCFLTFLETYISKFVGLHTVSFELGGKEETCLSSIWVVMDFLASHGFKPTDMNLKGITDKLEYQKKARPIYSEIEDGKYKWTKQLTPNGEKLKED
mmetsp:Transcript_32598/g.49847  ORF Transcript_32598/g.49847 Transcript_32598/m.49847 type:complete len:199 (-) Transcript_32598:2-598(-)